MSSNALASLNLAQQHALAQQMQNQMYSQLQNQMMGLVAAGTGSLYSPTSNTMYYTSSNPATTSTTTTSTYMNVPVSSLQAMHLLEIDRILNFTDGQPHTLRFPDGTVIEVEANGSFTINDKNAKVVYKANRSRNFNPFLNASDKLEDFIKFCGQAGVKQDEVLNIPIKHFIGWLIVESAKADHEPTPDIPLLPDLRKENRPHCLVCGRFMSKKLKARKIEFCRPSCFETALHAPV